MKLLDTAHAIPPVDGEQGWGTGEPKDMEPLVDSSTDFSSDDEELDAYGLDSFISMDSTFEDPFECSASPILDAGDSNYLVLPDTLEDLYEDSKNKRVQETHQYPSDGDTKRRRQALRPLDANVMDVTDRSGGSKSLSRSHDVDQSEEAVVTKPAGKRRRRELSASGTPAPSTNVATSKDSMFTPPTTSVNYNLFNRKTGKKIDNQTPQEDTVKKITNVKSRGQENRRARSARLLPDPRDVEN